jgi:hypothetical protein
VISDPQLLSLRGTLGDAVLTSVQRSVSILQTIRRRLRGVHRRSASPQIRLLCFVDLVQDIDLILPIAVAARASGKFDVRICQTSWLIDLSPRVKALLAGAGFDSILVSRNAVLAGLKPDLNSVDALLMASESTAEPHRFGHALATRANAAQVRTFVMQHGLENIGLTYRGDGDHDFASAHILTWGDPRNLPDWVPETRRCRCIGVGTPKPAHDAAVADLLLPHGGPPIVGVFENLHWKRYSAQYTTAFLADLAATIAARPDLLFIVKPHHAGRWLTKNSDVLDRSVPNLIVADPTDPRWEPFTAGAIIERAAVVITTPSTVALDAARIARPVAVTGYDLDLPVYAPLPILRQAADWFDFIADALATTNSTMQEHMRQFCARHLLEGDVSAAVVAAIAADVAQSRPQSQKADV